jgi:ribosomal protein S18 acetylase RimI-like enzyme
METTYRIRRAGRDDMEAVLRLYGSAADWLQKEKDTNQWARPWPDQTAMNARVAKGISDGLTWMVEDASTLVGTITCRERGTDYLWTPDELRDPAVYVSRLIVSRGYAGQGIGAALIDWAADRAARDWQANWIRVDVWTTNAGLHEYYKNQGFTHLRTKEVATEWEYPSAALFQKPTADINRVAAARFKEGAPGT